jgi:hypothetical protein
MARIICSLFSTLVQKWHEYRVLWVGNNFENQWNPWNQWNQ